MPGSRGSSGEKQESKDPDAGDYTFYDMTGWCQIYGHRVKAWWCESAPEVPAVEKPSFAAPGRSVDRKPSPVGYWLPYTDLEDAAAIFTLLDQQRYENIAVCIENARIADSRSVLRLKEPEFSRARVSLARKGELDVPEATKAV